MRWSGRRESGNVEDRRGMGPRMAVGGGGLGLVILVVALLLGKNPTDVINNLGTQTQTQQVPGGPVESSPHEEEQKQFVSVVLADTEDIWGKLFSDAGETYRQPKVVLFTGQVESACGLASAASGPFYCPGDENVYLDLSFFDELSQRFGAKGDFAAAYVIAHEVGHHVQKQLGITAKIDAMRGRVSEKEYNEMSVRLELQADFLAGVFAHYEQQTNHVIEAGDIEEALNAASSIGDDRLQKMSQGYVVPDAFTHGTSAQRVEWFKKGFETGDMTQGDTFSIDYRDL
ncbi:MAG TPA: neutral zinc metallopeptidase [Candidatus Krumholzibacteria bacterium]|nr:neutral zinc metallopeptidase [Candidatus Krumholzibacteria bacterium]